MESLGDGGQQSGKVPEGEESGEGVRREDVSELIGVLGATEGHGGSGAELGEGWFVGETVVDEEEAARFSGRGEAVHGCGWLASGDDAAVGDDVSSRFLPVEGDVVGGCFWLCVSEFGVPVLAV